MTKSAAQLNTEIAETLSAPRASLASVHAYVTKYMNILAITGEPPVVEFRSNLGSKWLGRTTWSSRRPHTTLLDLQRTVLTDERTLERVIAHELIHHRDLLALTENEMALLRVGIKPAEHGAPFREGAARINAIMGADFVTTTSDKEYKQAPSRKELVILIAPLSHGRLGWAWAARLGPVAAGVVSRAIERDGARLVRTANDRWTRGVKIERFGGYSIPKDAQDAALLKELYDAA